MKKSFASLLAVGLLLIVLSPAAVSQGTKDPRTQAEGNKSQTGTQRAAPALPAPKLCPACIRAHMEFLASDALRGRGSATADELIAATYAASQLRAYAIAPAGDNGSYIQRAVLQQPKLTAPPQVTFTKPGAQTAGEQASWTYGNQFVALHLSQTHFSGPLRVINVDEDDSRAPGSVVLILGSDRRKLRAKAVSLASKGAVAVIIPASAERAAQFQQKIGQLPALPAQIEGQAASGMEGNLNLLETSPDATKALEALPENTTLNFAAASTSERKYTWNAVGILQGIDSTLRHTAVLLSAHLDHLGIGPPVNGDDIYNGADDNASGTAAVLELARVLGAGPKPKRTVIFALFGSEETGGLGSQYFRQNPPLPLKQIAANLEFEMLGRADPAMKADTVWLTGWERSNLGPTLAVRGAKLVRDPHPEQNFFGRSDNYVLAKKGVVAQTISSYGLHSDYHQPSDDLAHIDFKHMDAAIGSLLRPIQWLVNSSFTPKWNEGGKP
jgi:aminopeptidase YwaD